MKPCGITARERQFRWPVLMDSQIAPEGAIAMPNKRALNQRPVSQHAAYVPIVSVWAAALLSLPLQVMPPAMATGLGADVGLAGLSAAILATLAAGLGALLGFGAARSIAARQSTLGRSVQASIVDAPVSEIAAEIVQPTPTQDILVLEEANIEPDEAGGAIAEHEILVPEPIPEPIPDPAQELTVAVNFLPWADALEQPSAEIISAAPIPEAAPEAEPETAPEVEQIAKPVAVLEAIPAQLLPQPAETISVKIDEPAQATSIGGKAVRQLRGTHVADLNMVQLLERFAVALDHYRDAADSQQGDDLGDTIEAQSARPSPMTNFYPESDAVSPRSGVSTRTRAIETENALRNALNDLDRLSGAA